MPSLSFLVFLLFIFNLILGVVCQSSEARRDAVPVVYAKGTHYDVGVIIGKTFSGPIKSFIASCDSLRQFKKELQTEAGRQAYDLTLTNMQERFPQYIHEMEGVADGAGVSFEELLLLQMDDVIETINENRVPREDTGGCTSIAINSPETSVLGHTEDALSVTVNHFYIVSAHIIPSEEDKQRGAREERFASLSYAGQMPGYTSGFNQHGLVFSINTLSPLQLKPGNTPRTFLARALLASHNVTDAQTILWDEGLGVANGFSVNMIWTTGNKRQLYNAEVGPHRTKRRSRVYMLQYDTEPLIHVNIYQRLKTEEVTGPIVDSSNVRMRAIGRYPTPTSRLDIEAILSDTSEEEFHVYESRPEAVVQTICAGIFDVVGRTWSIYTGPPKSSEPIAVLPIRFQALDPKYQ